MKDVLIDYVPDVPAVMRNTFGKMFLGLLFTAITAFGMLAIEPLKTFMITNMWIVWTLFIVEFIMVIVLSARIEKLKSLTASLLFYGYSILNGITLAPVFLIYTSSNVAMAFVISAVMFGAMALIGYFTKHDLSSWGSYLFMALIGLIIALLASLFFHSTVIDLIISCVAVIVFVGLTAWDTQQIKEMAETKELEPSKIATYGALGLYLDFINLFLHVLRILTNTK